jgi:hypothetical protein
VVFTAGIAEAKSKGRGEECISQNLRILRARNGRQVILFFTNSQRKEKKKYITVPRKYLYTCPTARAVLHTLQLLLSLGLSSPARERERESQLKHAQKLVLVPLVERMGIHELTN